MTSVTRRKQIEQALAADRAEDARALLDVLRDTIPRSEHAELAHLVFEAEYFVSPPPRLLRLISRG